MITSNAQRLSRSETSESTQEVLAIIGIASKQQDVLI